MIRPPPRSPLFPYTTLSRSARERAASPRERAYIEALAKRYAPIPPADRAALDAAYAAAMGDVVKRYPNDLDAATLRSEEHTSELQSQSNLVCRLLLEKKKKR